MRKTVAILSFSLLSIASGSSSASFGDSSFDFWKATSLIEARQGTEMSDKVRGVRKEGYESSDGRWIGMRSMYSSEWRDSSVSWLTQVSPEFGVIWGFSTGERAEKYRIDPSLKLGFAFQKNINRDATIYLTASRVFGGRLRENTCQADYGEIGGVQKVNCRLAATFLAPEETLAYLYNEKPSEYLTANIKFNYIFD